MVAFCVVGMTILHFTRRHQERFKYTDRARRLLETCQMFREGDIEKGQTYLDEHLDGTLYRTAYDVPNDEMQTLARDILWIWQETKAYFETCEVNEPYAGAIIPHVRRKLRHVPWSDRQQAKRKFDETYGGGKWALAPRVDLKSWIGRPLGKETMTGKVLLLDFWNTHCGPCVKAHPQLQRIHETYQEHGLLVIGCAGGSEEETKAYLAKHGYTFSGGMASRQMCRSMPSGPIPPIS
jgi:thiol-disulfide isomerase/thioredoxin